MKKSKLISLLEQIEGDPDIMLWDDHMNDCQDVNPTIEEHQLVRISFEAYVRFIESERKVSQNNPEYKLPDTEITKVKKLFTDQHAWEINPWVTEEDIKNKIYTTKKVYIVKPKHKDKAIPERFTKQKYKT
jgi:hypothetical protein